MKKGQKDLYITNIYSRNDEKCPDIKKLLKLNKENHLITGDINAHHEYWAKEERTDPKGKKLAELIDEHGLIVLNTGEKTRIAVHRNQNESTPDISIISGQLYKDNITWRVDQDPGNSDHRAQIIEIKTSFSNTPAPPNEIKFKTKLANWDNYRNELKDVNWDELQGDNSEITLDNIEKIINKAGLIAIPNNKKAIDAKKVNRTFHKYFKTVPWWTPEIQEAKKNSIKLYNKYKFTKEKNDEVKWKLARNKKNRMIDKAKKKAFKEFISGLNIKSNPKQSWDRLKALEGQSKNTKSNIPIKKADNTEAIDDKEKADTLGDYFEKVSSDSNLDPEFLEKIKEKKETYEKLKEKLPINDNNYYNQPITLRELEGALRSKTESAAGADGITYNMIKKLTKTGKTSNLKII